MTELGEIGRRLKAYRIGRGQTADEVAEKLGISRAAVYRIESGDVVKIGILERLASELHTSLASLLGVSIEYLPSAISYFERMRQIEEELDQVVDAFSAYFIFADVRHLPDTSEKDAGRVSLVTRERKE